MKASQKLILCSVLLCQASFLLAQTGAPYSREEAARRLARIQAIAASSNGKIEISVVSLAAEPPRPSPPAQEIRYAAALPVSADSLFAPLYAKALQYFYDQKYDGALESFQSLAAMTTDAARRGDCLFYLGECYLQFLAYEEAISCLRSAAACPGCSKQDDALFRLAMTWWRLGDAPAAKTQLRRLLALVPESEYAAVVKNWLSQIG